MKAKTVLLVEDDYVDVANFQRVINKLNIQVELFVAHNGKDALDMLNGNSAVKLPKMPDIILLDINMPKMNGLEFLRIIRNYISLNHLKIYITTTSSEEYDKISAESLGVAGYIVKPLEFDKKGPDHQAALDLRRDLTGEPA